MDHMRLQKETEVGRRSLLDRPESMMWWTRPVAAGMEKNGLIEERFKARLRMTWRWGVRAREKSVMMSRFLAWQMGVH